MIEYEKRAMIEAEDKYTFRQSTQISMQTGLIGHLRADMDTDGNGFFSSWFDFREELKTDEFKAEFDDVINSLREDGDILHNRRALAKYCYCTPQSRMQEEPGYYGVRVDTEKYAYLLRLNPDRGEYNLYCCTLPTAEPITENGWPKRTASRPCATEYARILTGRSSPRLRSVSSSVS